VFGHQLSLLGFGSNRTIVGLKLSSPTQQSHHIPRSNRTIVGLKQGIQAAGTYDFYMAAIAPLWD